MMIRSMTGFGRAERSVRGCRIQVEMKSVNNRYHEIAVRMPKEWLRHEDGLRRIVQQHIRRGRIDIFVVVERESTAGGLTAEFDWALADAYMQTARQLSNKYGLESFQSVHELLSLPDLFHRSEPAFNEDDQVAALLACTEEALEQLVRMRQEEGRHMQSDIDSRLYTMEQAHRRMTLVYPQAMEQYRETLRSRIHELLEGTGPFDEQRFAMEIAVMAERTNIDEELTRLHSHIDQFRSTMSETEPIGRKLDFLIQEMNREINTIGSKSNDSLLIQDVIDLKAELEKIREQVQNLE